MLFKIAGPEFHVALVEEASAPKSAAIRSTYVMLVTECDVAHTPYQPTQHCTSPYKRLLALIRAEKCRCQG